MKLDTYAFTPSLLALGEYNLTYTYTLPSTGCVKTATQKIIIGPKIELGANQTVCLNSPAFVPSITSPTGGTWSVAGVNLTNNLFNPATRTRGDYIATYTFTDAYGCTNTATKTITVKGTPIVNITQTPPTGLQYSYYENNSLSAWGGMPSFTNLAPARTGTATNINLTPASGRPRNYALVFEGSLKVPTSGNYTFNLSSVDGSKLYINNSLIANNDGQHDLQSRTGSVVLATNQKISIRVEYFSGNDRVPSLNLQWSGPGTPLQTIPNSAFSYPILFCEGTSLTLTASTGTSFLWSNGSTQGLSTEVTTSGTYSVTIRDQDGCSATSNTIDVATQPAPFGDIVPTKGTGLDYSYYENNSGQPWNNLPDFNALSIVKTGNTPNIDLNLRNRSTNMGFVFEGQIYLPVDGQYVFYTSSDDGSWLQIDNALVVSNGGLHGIQERSGFVNLTKGFHNIRINFFQAGGGLSLTASYQGPGIAKQVIPNNVLFRPKPLCLLSPVTLASGTATSYAWNTGATTNTITTTTPGTYSVQITGTNGCKSTISESVVLDQLPTVDIVTATPNVGCAGSFTNGLLIANPTGKQPFKYQWKRNGTNITGATSQSYTFNSTGNYTVTLTDACGNSVTSTSFVFEIITQPDFVLSTYRTIPTMCAMGDTEHIRVAITGYNNTRSYEVTMNPGAITKIIAPNTLVTQPAIEFPITSPDNYSVTVRDQRLNNTCVAKTNTIAIASKPNPTVTATLQKSEMCYTEAALKLTGGLPIGGKWEGTGVSKIGADYFFTPSVSNVVNNVLAYSFTATNGCSSSANVTMKVSNIIPAISLGFDQVIEKNVPVTLTATANLPVTWSTGATGFTLDYTPTTTTTLTASISNGCGSATDNVILIDPCTFSGYYTKSDATFTNPVLSGTLTGGGVFSGVYLVKRLVLNDGLFTAKPGTIFLLQNDSDLGTAAFFIGAEEGEPYKKTTLKMDGVTMTSACDQMWYSIIVNPNQSLLINQDVNNSYRSKIMNATEGVYFHTFQTSISATEIKVKNTDFKNHILGGFFIIGPSTYFNMGALLKIENCVFDSNPETFLSPYNKTSNQSNYSDQQSYFSNGDFSNCIVDNCDFKNTRIGVSMLVVSKPPKFTNCNFINCFQYGISNVASYESASDSCQCLK